MQKKFVLLTIVLLTAVLTTGCLENGETETVDTDGVNVDFSTTEHDAYRIDVSDLGTRDQPTATFNVDLHNQGRPNAILKSLKLYRAHWISDDDAYFEAEDLPRDRVSVSIDINEWSDWRDELLERGSEYIVEKSIEELLDLFHGGERLSDREEKVAALLLEGRRPDEEFDGERKSFSNEVEIGLDEGDLRAGEERSFDVGLETVYQYYNVGNADFTIYPQDEYRDVANRDEQVEVSQLGGPVSISVRNLDRHISDRTGTIYPTVVVENVGPGRFRTDDDGQSYLYGRYGFFPSGSTYPTEVYIEGDSASVRSGRCELNARDKVTFRGSKLEAQCPIDIDEVENLEDVTLRVSTVYDYVQTDNTIVNVIGR